MVRLLRRVKDQIIGLNQTLTADVEVVIDQQLVAEGSSTAHLQQPSAT